MRKITWTLAIVICVSMFLAACGAKNAEDVVKDLEQKRAKLDSYKGTVNMTFHTGQEPMKYDVEVWYKKDNFYRIALTNKQKDVTQIVLRNEDGVFVLTPHLKKSFRFQSDWPDNQGEIYLYQTLLDGILEDEGRLFTEDKESGTYVFQTAGNYKNHSFASQKIWLKQGDYAPKRVEISDSAGNLLVELDFKDFKFGAQFESQDFDMQHNLTMHSVTTAASPGGEDAQPIEPTAASFGVIEPAYVPEDVALVSQPAELSLGEEQGIMLRYGGAYNYVLVESRPLAQTVSYTAGEIVDLGFGIGVLSGEEQRTLHWTLDGVEYRLMSGDLPKEEMIRIAQSVQGQSGK
jgi:outer membrane lipoprotein-sorting protein